VRRRDGASVIYGDASRRETLCRPVPGKRAVVITFADTPMAPKILHHVRQLRGPSGDRAHADDSELDWLFAAGRRSRIPEVLEEA
jgi:hypothetical protein